MGPNTSVGGKFSIDDALVHSDSRTGKAHPVGHGRSKERTAIRDSVLSDVSIGVHRFASGIENAAVEVGALLLNLLDNAITPWRGGILGTSTRNAIVHGDLVTHYEEAALQGEVDIDATVRRIRFFQYAVIFPALGRVGVVFRLEVGVGCRWVGIHKNGIFDDSLIGICRDVFGTTRGQQAKTGANKEGK